MDFNKIKINYGGKLTCRKVFKKRYTIFLVISLVCIIFLIAVFTIKNKKLLGVEVEVEELNKDKFDNNMKINIFKNKNMEERTILARLNDQMNIINNDIEEISKKEDTLKKKNSEILSEKGQLEKKSETLNSQLKKENELKDVYVQKTSSLNTLLDSLKIEYSKLLEQKGDDEENPLSIKNSKIINVIETSNIEKTINGIIRKKCFDGEDDKFNPIVFHQKCDKSALLVLIKTDNNERIGAFTKASFEGLEIKRDPSTALFNIDQGKFYTLASSEYSTIVCDPNELPQFGVDLQIKSNGQGINSFPFNYGDKNKNASEDLTQNHVFKIVNLEIYKIDL